MTRKTSINKLFEQNHLNLLINKQLEKMGTGEEIDYLKKLVTQQNSLIEAYNAMLRSYNRLENRGPFCILVDELVELYLLHEPKISDEEKAQLLAEITANVEVTLDTIIQKIIKRYLKEKIDFINKNAPTDE